MSRIGKMPIRIPSGVTVEIKENEVIVKGPKGELKQDFDKRIKIEMKDDEIIINRTSELKHVKSLHGLYRSLIANMVEGVSKGFEKRLEIVGVGYRAQAAKNKITLNLGFSHPVEFKAPEEIEFKMDEENKNVIIIQGVNKQTVGEVAAKVRSYRKPEPYKGKGIRYLGEQVQRKAGKAAASAGS